MSKFLALVPAGCPILSAACGAGRYDGRLLAAGHAVTGTDQSAGMLARAREHFPQARYEQISMQALGYHAQFGGLICMDAMEHVPPEDYPGVLSTFARALDSGGLLYFTADTLDTAPLDGIYLEKEYQQARQLGLPVVFGEYIEGSQAGDGNDHAGYHYYPPLE